MPVVLLGGDLSELQCGWASRCRRTELGAASCFLPLFQGRTSVGSVRRGRLGPASWLLAALAGSCQV